MAHDTIFTVKNEDLNRLSPAEAVTCFRHLLWSEAQKQGIPISNVSISSWINVPDGGIDASVNAITALPQNDLIRNGRTGYQIKAAESFKPWQKTQIRKELFGSKAPSRDYLNEGIKNLLDENGTYILVCFKQDLLDSQCRKALDNLQFVLNICGYESPKIAILSQNNLIGYISTFPSLALQVNGHASSRFQTHHSWSQDAEMRRPFTPGPSHENLFSEVQHALRHDTSTVHIRVWGEPGIGKTRFVLEATRTDDLSPLVIYCDSAVKFRDSDLMNEVLRDDNQFFVVLVVDECSQDDSSYIWNKLKYRGSRIKMLSLSHEYDETSGTITFIAIPPLDQEQTSTEIPT
jgi:hypothetical protein